LENIFVYDLETRSAAAPELGDFPWPVILLLGGRSKKFIFSAGKMKPKVNYIENITNGFYKLAWRYLLAGSDTEPQWWKAKVKRKFTQGPDNLPPVVAAALSTARDSIIDHVMNTVDFVNNQNKNNQNKCRFCSRGNMFPAIKFAFQWLRDKKVNDGMVAVPSDKDGGFVLIKRKELEILAFEKINKGPYNEIALHRNGFPVSLEHLFRILYRIEETWELPNFAKFYIRLLLGADWRQAYAKIICTVKTHKSVGEVGVRLIHSCPKSPFSPIGQFVNKVLRQTLDAVPFIYSSSDVVRHDVMIAKLPANVKLYKLDVEDFFMNGSHEELSFFAACGIADRLQRKAFQELVLFLLTHQYVRFYTSKYDTEAEFALFQVEQGSGMGSNISGDISDMCLYNVAEKDLVVDVLLNRYGIAKYMRYRDDVFIIAINRPIFSKFSSHAFIAKLVKAAARVYKILLEAVSTKSADFLDMTLSVPKNFNKHRKLTVAPYFKVTNQRVMLSSDSYHNPQVFSWPIADLQRLMRRSSSSYTYNIAKDYFVQLCERSRIDKKITHTLRNSDFFSQFCTVRHKARNEVRSRATIVLPFNKALLASGICSLFTKLNTEHPVAQLLSELNAKLAISWSNSEPNIDCLVRGTSC